MTTRGHRRTQRTVLAWLLLGLVGFALLPWYFQQDMGLIKALPGVFGGRETASGLVQALQHGKPWLWIGLVGLAIAAAAWPLPPSRLQGGLLAGGGALGLVGLLAAGFGIGAQGWSYEWLNTTFGALAGGQFGMGLGGALVLLALLMLMVRAWRGWATSATMSSSPVRCCSVRPCCCSLWRCRWPRA